jgi:uncharacterized protein (TIRG00374 family)
VNKKTLGNLLKYGLAIGMMVYVVWSNWGDPRGTAGRIVVGEAEGKGKVSGKVVAYTPDDSITLEGPSGTRTDLALKRPGFSLKFWGKPARTDIVRPDGEPWPDGETLVGQEVSAAEISRGLAYVWQRNVKEGAPVHWGYFTLAFVIGFVSLVSTFLRWHVLVRAVGLPFRLADAMRLGFIGLFFNTFLPGSVGGDAIKAWFLAKEQSRRTLAVATVIMDRVIALWALVWFVALLGGAFWLGGSLDPAVEGAKPCRQIVVVSWVVVGVTTLVWALLGLLSTRRAHAFAERLHRLPRVGGAAAEFWRAVWVYRCRPWTVYFVMVISLVGFLGFVLLFYYSMLTLWDPSQEVPTLAQHFLIVPIGLVIGAVPLFPGGAGIGELGFGLLYGWLGASEASGVLGSLVQRVIMWISGLIGYVIYKRMHLAKTADGGWRVVDGDEAGSPSTVQPSSPAVHHPPHTIQHP